MVPDMGRRSQEKHEMHVKQLTDSASLSVVVPMYSEEGNVHEFVRRAVHVLSKIELSWELILVDDGSFDCTWEAIQSACDRNMHVKGIRLGRNFGHQHALLAGFENAQGKAIISMDGDLQHPPEVIPKLVEAWQDGHLVVTTRRRDAEVTGWFKRITSSVFYSLFRKLTGVSIVPGTSDFRLLDRRALDALLRIRTDDLFFRGAINWLGFRSHVVAFDVATRHDGISKYSFRMMLRFATAGMVAFSRKPLSWALWLGVVAVLLAVLEIAYVLVHVALGHVIPGWASIAILISGFMGVQFFILGVLGIYIGRIHLALQQRPLFTVIEVENLTRCAHDPVREPVEGERFVLGEGDIT